MTKDQFLSSLNEALSGNISPSLINENIRYYEEYIETEKRKGHTEEEVLDELGDPRLIAKTISDTADSRDKRGAGAINDTYYNNEDNDGDDDPYNAGMRYKRIQGWKVLAILATILIIFLAVFTLAIFLVGSFIIAFWPAIIVAMVIWWIFNPLRFD
ncbi:MAG: DUF1700 domain-containing protein [Lachnospiraceae bacterium]|nr:DUF1700 domain-containing protein [Lachnospiraceae bacterium]